MNAKIHLNFGVAGRYRIDAIRPDGSIRELAPWFDNLITDRGLDFIGSAGTTIDNLLACQVGTGNTTPTNGDTNLASYLAGTATHASDTNGIQGTSPRYAHRTVVYQFAQGAAAGNLAEVGVGRQSATGNLFSRALILDGGGSPTTITVLADEILSVTYEFRLYIPEDDVDSSIVISSVTYDTVTRSLDVGNINWWSTFLPSANNGGDMWHQLFVTNGSLVAITGANPTGASTDSVTQTVTAYSSGTHYIERTAAFSIGQANLSAPGISAAYWTSSFGAYQMSFDPPIAKDNTKTLTLVTRVAWARYTP